MPEKLTDEEHQARAMLLGMSYHHGRGDPVYFEIGPDGLPDVTTFIDANTLVPLRARDSTPALIESGRRAYRAIISTNVDMQVKRTLNKKAQYAAHYGKGRMKP